MHTEQLLRTKKTVEKPETHKRKINKRKTEKTSNSMSMYHRCIVL